MPSWITGQLLVSIITILVVVHVILVTCAMLIYLERKISAYIQDRIGPNRTGFDFGQPELAFLKGMWGLGQSLADGLKFLLKEDFTPAKVDKLLYSLAPMAIIIPALMGFAVIPWGGVFNMPDLHIGSYTIPGGEVTVAGANISIGVIYLLAIAALGVYGVTLGGYASNNKFSFLGGLRATAQMISYEVPMGLMLLAVLLAVGSLAPMDILRYQEQHGWLILHMPLVAIIFYIATLAEANRAPFDNAEAEQELVGGYHTEYSSMRFALFFLAEYSHVVTSSAFITLLFLGGFEIPGVSALSTESTGLALVLAKFIVYFVKVLLVICLTMLVRWSIPRLRYDQIMMMAWQTVIPLSLITVVTISGLVWWFGTVSLVAMLAANAGLMILAVLLQPILQPRMVNHRLPLYGSRFSPAAGQRVITQPTDPNAREDHPIQGTAPMA